VGDVECNKCEGEGQVACNACSGSGYRFVDFSLEMGKFFHPVFSTESNASGGREEVGSDRLQLVNWISGEPVAIRSGAKVFAQQLQRNIYGNLLHQQARLDLVRQYALRFGKFKDLLEEIQGIENLRELGPIAFQGLSASVARRRGRVVFDFVLPETNCEWARDNLSPFPPGARVVFLPPGSRNGQRITLRWAEGAKAPTDGAVPEGVFVGTVRIAENRVGLRIAFSTNIDVSSVPSTGYLKADLPPPSEKTQIRHLDLWTQPANWSNALLQEMLFGKFTDDDAGKVEVLDKGILQNPSQYAAVCLGCSQVPMALIKGPPGTGKTTVIVEIIRQLVSRGQKLLICSQTHQAVRNVLERLHSYPEIRMIRHGRDEKLSELERTYLPGGINQPSWASTLEQAGKSLRRATEEYERQAGPLLLLEKAHDAAVRLQETREWFAGTVEQITRSAELEHARIDAEALECAERCKRKSERDLLTQQLRRTELFNESEWIQKFEELCQRRLVRLPRAREDSLQVSAAEGLCDSEMPRHLLPSKILEIAQLCQLHSARYEDLNSDVKQLDRELADNDCKRKESEREAVDARDKTIGTIKQESQAQEEELLARGKGQKKAAASELKSELAEIRARLASEIDPLEVLILEKSRTAAPLERSLSEAEAACTRYEELYKKKAKTGRSPSKKDNPIGWGKLVPDFLASADLLQARYAEACKLARSIQNRLGPIQQKLANFREIRETLRRKEEREIGRAEDRNLARQETIEAELSRDGERIKVIAEERVLAATRLCSDRLKQIQTEWSLARGQKPEDLSVRQSLLLFEKALLSHLNGRKERLMGWLEHPWNRKHPDLPASPEAEVPDCKASLPEQERRAHEIRRELGRLVLVRSDLERRLEDVEHQESTIRQKLDQELGNVQHVQTQRHAVTEVRQNTELNHVRDVLAQEEVRCRLAQRDAIQVAASLKPERSFSEEESAQTWETLAAILRAPLKPLLTKLEFLQRWQKDLESGKQGFEQLFWEQTDVFLTTCVGAGSWYDLVKHGRSAVDLVIIDEAAHATAPETIIPMLYGTRTLLIGDEMQLPPLNRYALPMPQEDWLPDALQERLKESSLPGRLPADWLERSLFEWIYRERPGVRRVMLNTQFRMHPAIADFVGSVFYPEGLESGVKADDRSLQFAEFTRPICLISTSNDRENFEHIHEIRENEFAKSYSNRLEAALVERVVKKAAEHLLESASVGIITPYAPQKELIRRRLENVHGQFGNLDLDFEDVGSVDSYQGSERDIIIVSFVRSPRACNRCGGSKAAARKACPVCNGRGYLGSGLRFVHDLRRLNVAFSRARKMLILVGNMKALTDPKFGGTEEGRRVLGQFASYIQDRGKVLHVWEDVHGD
jgi:DNA polymerase III delta prime subunit